MSTTTLTIDLATSDASPSANYDTGQFTKLNTYSSSIPTTFDSYIQRGYDYRWAGIAYSSYYSQYDFFHPYFRFVNVAVPQGSTISSAYLKLEVPAFPAGYPASDGDTFRIAGYDSDDVSQPSAGSDGAMSLHTSATVDGWQLRSDEGITTSPDIKTIIQEIVDRAGWSSGNAMMLMVWQPTAQSSTYRRYYNTGKDSDDTAPQLVIEYESGGGAATSSIVVTKVNESSPIQNGTIVVQSPKGARSDAGTANYIIRGMLDEGMASVPTTGMINSYYENMFTGCPPCTGCSDC